MITRDKEIFEAKEAEICSIRQGMTNLDDNVFASTSKDAIDRILIELETISGVDDLLSQLKASIDSVKDIDMCEMVACVAIPGINEEDVYAIDSALERCISLVYLCDNTLEDGHFKLTLFLYVKDHICTNPNARDDVYEVVE